MTPTEALSVIDQATAAFHGTRQDHMNIQAAMGVLNQLVLEADTNCDKDKTAPENSEPVSDLPTQTDEPASPAAAE